MKRLFAIVCGVLVGASLSYGSGLGVFVSHLDPDNDYLDSATGGGAKLTVGDTIGFELRASYFEIDFIQLPDYSIEAIPVDAGLILSLPLGDSPVSLYVDGGATWYFLDSDLGDIDDEVGWYAGGGLEVTLADNLALFAEAQYRSLEPKKSSWIAHVGR